MKLSDGTQNGMTSSRLLLILLLPAILIVAGCGDDETSENGTDAGSDTGAVDQGSDAPEITWEDFMLRVTDVDVTRPSGVGAILSGIINPEIRADNIHILIEMTDFQAETGTTTFQLHGDAGAVNEDDGTYYFIGEQGPEASSVEADGTYSNTTAVDVDFPIRFAVNPVCDGGTCPDGLCRDDNDCRDGFTCDADRDGRCFKLVILPLHEVFISGQLLYEDGAFAVQGSELSGLILKSEADGIEIDLGGSVRLLTEVLQEGNMDCPEGADPPTAWCLDAVINAEQVNNE